MSSERLSSPASRIRIAAGTLTLAFIAVGIPSSANAVPASVPSVDLVTDADATSFTYLYGAAAPESRRIEIGAATTQLVIPAPFRALGYDVECRLSDAEGAQIATRVWFTDDWDVPSERTLDVPVGSIAEQPGLLYSLHCFTEEMTFARATWQLVSIGDAPAVVDVRADESTLTSVVESVFYVGGDYVSPRLARGDRVRVFGQPGSWFAPGVPQPVDVQLTVADGGVPVWGGPADDINVRNDGSILGFTVPADLPADAGSRIDIRVSSSATTRGDETTPTRTRSVGWATEGVLVEKTMSTTSLSLNRAYTSSSRFVQASIRVSTESGAPPVGTVTLFVDGRRGASVQLTALAAGRASLGLPKDLSRGSHNVVATFSGDDSSRGSASESRRFLVLIG